MGTTFAERLGQVVEGDSIHAFSKKAGISDSTFRQYLSGTMPGLEKLIKIADAGNVTLDWLATGKGPMRLLDRAQSPGLVVYGADGATISVELKPYGLDKRTDLTLVPRLDVQASAGSGILAFQEQPVELVAFQSAWLRSIGINPQFARLVTSAGDSMEPTIRDGDLLLVDTSIHTIRDNGIYCVVYGNMLLVKRIHPRLNGSLQIISDNPVYPPEEVMAADVPGLTIAGRVMWFSRPI